MRSFTSFSALFLSLVTLATCQDTNLTDVKAAFDEANIPANTSLTFDPRVLFQVSFPQPSGEPVLVHAGVQLDRNVTVGPPLFSIANTTIVPPEQPFVVAVVDLDAPTPQNASLAQIRHFLGGHYFISETTGELNNQSAALSEFLQPSPPNGSDPHRYVFLLFPQSKEFANQTLVNSTTSIAGFNISQFADELNLGPPLGGTFILVGPEAANATATEQTETVEDEDENELDELEDIEETDEFDETH